MKRSLWKLPFIHSVFFKKRLLFKSSILVKLRHSTIPEHLIGKAVKVHNGAWFLSNTIIKNMVGHKFGEFSFTKRSGDHLKSKKKKQKKKSR